MRLHTHCSLAVALLACLALPGRAGAETVLRGNNTWKGPSPVWVLDSVVVPAGATLTIQPGTLVLFAPNPQRSPDGGGLSIRVEGTLRAVGSPELPIRFRGANPYASPASQWDFGRPYDVLQGWNQFQGIIFAESARPFREDDGSGCLLRDVIFEGAYEPVRVEGSHVKLQRCTFLRSGAGGDRGGGVTLLGGVAEGCVFEWSGDYALRVGGGAEVSQCVLEKGFHDGVHVEGTARFSNCTIRLFPGVAIDVLGGGLELLYTRIDKCSNGLRFSSPVDPPPFLYDCDFLELGWPLPGAAVLIQTPDAGPPPGFVKLDTEGGVSRVLSAVAVLDEAGETEIFARDVWWGRADITPAPPRFVGRGSRFRLDPVLEQDPHGMTWEYRGSVVDAGGVAVGDVMVSLQDSNSAPGRTDEEGNYSLTGVQPGRYSMRLYKPGWGLLASDLDWLTGTNLYTVNARPPLASRDVPPGVRSLRVVSRATDGTLTLEGNWADPSVQVRPDWVYDVRWAAQPLREDRTDAGSWAQAKPALSTEALVRRTGEPQRWRVRLPEPAQSGYLALQIVDSLGQVSPLSLSVSLE